jgi:hypothetical protein
MKEDNLHGMVEKDIQSGSNEKVDQQPYDYMEYWF